MYIDRINHYEKLEKMLDTKLLVYVTGDRPGWETQISTEVLDILIQHLDTLGDCQKISLFLYTKGGMTIAAWSIVNLIRQFCRDFQIIVPSKALSSGTLMCLGANSIIMTKQATLGPIDPSVNTLLNPQIPGGNPDAKMPVSVEAIKGFFELAKSELNIKDEKSLATVMMKLSDVVHPLVLGEVFRAKAQIQMLARKLLVNHELSTEKVNEIISFLVSDSGSHDYTIYRKEAKEQLGLNIIVPTPEEYGLIKTIYDDIVDDLKLNVPYDQVGELGMQDAVNYDNRRCLIESVHGGSHYFTSEGMLTKVQFPSPTGHLQEGIQDQRLFEGWRHEYAKIPHSV